MDKKKKGNLGYINHYKKMQGIMGFAGLAMVFIIYFTGYIMYDTNKSLFSVIAAVSVLPAAKYLIGFFLVLPYKSSDRQLFDRLLEFGECGLWIKSDIVDNVDNVDTVKNVDVVENVNTVENVDNSNPGDTVDKSDEKLKTGKCTIISDIIFTYDSKIMNIDYIVINSGHVLAYSDCKKTDLGYAGSHIKKILDNSCNYKSFRMYSGEDEFIKAVRDTCEHHTGKDYKTLENDMVTARKLLPFSI